MNVVKRLSISHRDFILSSSSLPFAAFFISIVWEALKHERQCKYWGKKCRWSCFNRLSCHCIMNKLAVLACKVHQLCYSIIHAQQMERFEYFFFLFDVQAFFSLTVMRNCSLFSPLMCLPSTCTFMKLCMRSWNSSKLLSSDYDCVHKNAPSDNIFNHFSFHAVSLKL